jgi:hypothetical protein
MSEIPAYSFDVTNFVLGLSVGMILAIAFVKPRVGQAIARTIAVVLLMLGVGMLSWAIYTVATADTIAALEVGNIVIEDASEVIGWGAGAFFGGIVALWLSFVRVGARE